MLRMRHGGVSLHLDWLMDVMRCRRDVNVMLSHSSVFSLPGLGLRCTIASRMGRIRGIAFGGRVVGGRFVF